MVGRFFFIRYWEGGQHIRFRIQPLDENFTDQICQLLRDRFEDFFHLFPSNRIDTPGGEIIYPNDSVQFIDYNPEIKRYGGNHGIELAEEHFELSSTVTLQLICRPCDFDYEQRLAHAINLNLAFAKCVFKSKNEKTIFYKHLFHQWLPHAMFALNRSGENIIGYDMIQESYEALFQKNKKSLHQYKYLIDELIESNEKFEENWMNIWIERTIKIHCELTALNELKLLADTDSPEINSINNIYLSYFHMLNNRLGIQNKDESLVSYLLFKLFE
ncbi:thiopeptide-type bacteriocin biosynthesis domain-containing protein [Dyadobacter koreensis]|uniref:Thiopeptide-type bacteriocin biosynthesis domain-containing protein n=2 Tax=Dyadobacter koreensis TaxID=408657 RepID=A0A1H7B660_9BACT|nr:thiopeptide-type bacteriocin biosynthesis domain-containing protein [Dyadobacter koreensis]